MLIPSTTIGSLLGLRENQEEQGESLNLIVLPSIMGTAAYIHPLIEFFRQRLSYQQKGKNLFNLDVFTAVDDRVKRYSPVKKEDSFSNNQKVQEVAGVAKVISVEKLAEVFAIQMINQNIIGPCVLLGWSFGGSLAYQVYVELNRLKNNPDPKIAKKAKSVHPYVVLIDTVFPHKKRAISLNIQIDWVLDSVNDVVGNLKIDSECKEILRVDKKKISVDGVEEMDDFIGRLIKYYYDCKEKNPELGELISFFEGLVFPNIKASYQYNPRLEGLLSKDMKIIMSTETKKAIIGKSDGDFDDHFIREVKGNHYSIFADDVGSLFDAVQKSLDEIALERSKQEVIWRLRSLQDLGDTTFMKQVLELLNLPANMPVSENSDKLFSGGFPCAFRSASVPLPPEIQTPLSPTKTNDHVRLLPPQFKIG